MNKEEIQKKLESRLLFLQRNVPPDDIYGFCDHIRLCAEFFMCKWLEHVEMDEAIKDPVANAAITNICTLLQAFNSGNGFRDEVLDEDSA